MTAFRVTWTIDIEADTAEEAAEQARLIQLNPHSTAVVFGTMNMETFEGVEVDLDEELA